MRRTICILSGLLLCLVVHMCASENGGCKLGVIADDNGLSSITGKPPGPAVIFGGAVKVPTFRLRFVDKKTGEMLKPDEVSLAYGWKWLQYPYPEHSWGAWSGASDLVTCTGTAGEISVPAFEVKPRGWYNGKYAKFPLARKPSFTGITVTVTVAGCSPRVTISAEEARGLQGRTVVVKVDCHGESKVTYQK